MNIIQVSDNVIGPDLFSVVILALYAVGVPFIYQMYRCGRIRREIALAVGLYFVFGTWMYGRIIFEPMIYGAQALPGIMHFSRLLRAFDMTTIWGVMLYVCFARRRTLQ